MRIKTFAISAILLAMTFFVNAQNYSIIIKGGHVIDPKNKIDGIMDLAINDGKIAMVAPSIDAREGKQVIDAKDLDVTP